MRYGFLSLSGSWCFKRFDWMWGGSCHFLLVLPPPPRAQCRARVWVIGSLFEAQDCRFFVFDQILLSPEAGGDQGTLFTHNVVRSYTGLSYLFMFLCCICSIFFG